MGLDKKIIIMLSLLGILLYANTLNHGYVLDDYSVIKDNFVVKKGVDGIPTIWKTHYRYGYGYTQANLFRPLTLTLFAIQWELSPDNPSFAHFFNIILYAAVGVLLYLFLIRLLGKEKRFIAFITSALFIAHPIHTEVVANIKSVDDIMAFGFSLLGIMQLLKHIDQKDKKALWLSLLFFTLAFLSKESTVTFLAIIPLCLMLFRSFKILDAFKKTIPFLIPFGIYMALRIKVLGSIGGNKTIAKIDNLLMAIPEGIERTTTAIKIMGLYLWKLIFPHPLMNDYSFNQITPAGIGDPFVLLSIIVYGFLIFALIKYWKNQKIISFGIAFFLITISLYSNILFIIGTSFGERLLFIPSFGFCLLLAYLVEIPFKQKIKADQLFQTAKTPLIIIVALIAMYGFKTIDRNKAWKDNYTLYSTDVLNCDQSARCHYYHGLELMKDKAIKTNQQELKQNYLLQSVNAFQNALRILPSYSDAWAQLGLAYFRLGNYTEAEKNYLKSVDFNPNNASAYSNLGSMYFQQQKYQEAMLAFEKALRANPNHLDALSNYASTLGTVGKFDSAITYFKRAIAIKPNEPNYYRMVGLTYQNMGNQQQAAIYLQKAQQLSQGR